MRQEDGPCFRMDAVLFTEKETSFRKIAFYNMSSFSNMNSLYLQVHADSIITSTPY